MYPAPTLSWISLYNPNPLKLPLKGNTDDDEVCCTINLPLHYTSINFTNLNRSLARKSNQFSITHYDLTVICYMAYSPFDTERAVNSQLTEKFFFKTDYIFDLDNTYKNFDHIIDHAVQNTKNTKSYFSKFYRIQLTLIFLIPKELDINC